jgi:general secretion pathway protein I
MIRAQQCGCEQCGFTLVEVLVALVIVAFGVGAVLAALSGSANNVAALREKTIAQWIALNRISDVRLNLQAPQIGTTEGDVRGFANGDWHWQQIVSAVQMIPGLMQITVKVRRNVAGTSGASTSGTSPARSSSREPDWVTTVVGFRGAAIAAATGEVPDWSGVGQSSSSSSGGSSSGSIPNPGTVPGTSPGTLPTTPTTPARPGLTPPGGTSSGGP